MGTLVTCLAWKGGKGGSSWLRSVWWGNSGAAISWPLYGAGACDAGDEI